MSAKPRPLKEFAVQSMTRHKWHGRQLNPNRIARWYVRATTQKRAIELLQQHASRTITARVLKDFGGRWGNHIIRPTHQGEGVWAVRDEFDKDLIEIWISGVCCATEDAEDQRAVS